MYLWEWKEAMQKPGTGLSKLREQAREYMRRIKLEGLTRWVASGRTVSDDQEARMDVCTLQMLGTSKINILMDVCYVCMYHVWYIHGIRGQLQVSTSPSALFWGWVFFSFCCVWVCICWPMSFQAFSCLCFPLSCRNSEITNTCYASGFYMHYWDLNLSPCDSEWQALLPFESFP